MKFLHVVLLFSFLTTWVFSATNVVKTAQIEKSELVLHFSKICDTKHIKHFQLDNPNRDVFDFYNARLKNLHISKQLPKGIRVAQYQQNIVRVVMQNNHNHKYRSYRPVLQKNAYHIGLLSSLPPVQKTSVFRKQKHSTKTINEIFSEVEMLNRDERRLATLGSVTNERQRKSVSSKYIKGNKRDLIVIDAGHGGHDGGATVGGKREKDLVLSIAKKTAKALSRRGFRVYLTRSSDRFLKLSQRTKIADKKGAAVFLSIHANSVPKKRRNKVHGIETFFLQTTRDAKSQRIAARENAAVLKGAGTKLSKHVIVDSVLNGPKIIESNKLAIDVQKRIITNVRSRYNWVKDGGVRHAPFYVLVGASRPSILVEVGYISNPRERKRLFSSKYQELIAKGIAQGVNSYLNNRKKEIDID